MSRVWVAVGNAVVIAAVALVVSLGVVAASLMLADPATASATEEAIKKFGGGNIKGE